MQNLLTDILKSQMGDSFYSAAGQAAHASPEQSRSAVEMAIPFFLGALAKNTSKPEGAASLEKALQKKHDGSLLSQLGDITSDAGKQDGAKILNHIFGNKQGDVVQELSQKVGIDSSSAGSLMQMLAPVVMGALGKEKGSKGLDAGGLSSLLQLSAKQFSGSGNSSLLMSFLDQDRDGKVSDDILSMIWKFFTKRK